MVIDFSYAATQVGQEAAVLEDMERAFAATGQFTVAEKLSHSVQRLRACERWIRKQITIEVNAVVKAEADQWNGVIAAVTDAIQAKRRDMENG